MNYFLFFFSEAIPHVTSTNNIRTTVIGIFIFHNVVTNFPLFLFLSPIGVLDGYLVSFHYSHYYYLFSQNFILISYSLDY